MKKYRVYFATKVHVFTTWFRRKERVSATDYVVVSGHNEAHAVKEAKKHIDLDELGLPFHVTQIREAGEDEAEGYYRQGDAPRGK
ncbi:hypothetical protein [Desulfolutivibrio sulfoxidireducens]|uniref:hypothetical protein n=1 Tax=Desulfolutivibrio sulfoxidireducens TaxID=2773299 RepID=UPI00159D954E|nr:hypothetical protein [Desulfolutivibrio sulfoxidireducens]QLA15333.1 hypothetical protein GD605_03850 [Desulfolutivibrio sulfoxidireducens]QLA18911.1 hypothetical protein GD604_03770 [Desulfolutivibrio sulfoxidireducens]